MLTIPGYRVSVKIHESVGAAVYRARREQDDHKVILKIMQDSYLTQETAARYKNEYHITCQLNTDGVVRSYGLEKYNNCPMLVMEDVDGESLKTLLESHNFDLPENLSIAVKIATALADIHAKNIIHKDINPANIIYNPQTSCLKIIDFGLSSLLSREQPAVTNPHILEGTLQYIAPEQTGRMNRAIDYRSDFYSLGATLYELFTGKRPFNMDDPLELVHCHIARQPKAPHEVNPAIPPVLSQIIMKLMAKNAEERYQSAWGIKADLEECYKQWQANGQVSAFPIAQHDLSDRFQITQKLYGREKEIHKLMGAFERTNTGKREVMLVTGYSGIGKTSLVREIYKPITARRGYFISGKFDQFQRNIPYKAVLDAFGELLRQLLTENEAQVQEWKKILLQALGNNGRVITDVLPDLELIIGPQPAVQSLGPAENQNRFQMAFHAFVKVFCRKEYPLVIYLDDLQWADSASLKLMGHILQDESLGHLLIIGAYRDNEVDATHPLTVSIEALEKQGVQISRTKLTPLATADVNQLVADALHSNTQAVMPLTELVMAKTGGNPFFTEEFLKSLYNEKLLSFNRELGAWEWYVDKIQAQNITDNIVELMTGKLRRLSPETQKALKLGACIGNKFDITTLSIVYEQPIQNTMQALREAVKEGLIVPTGSGCSWAAGDTVDFDNVGLKVECKFAHDRIQQAAYGLIEDNLRNTAHYKIGQLLLINCSAANLDSRIFDIINHLNFGIDLISEVEEKHRLAKLNLSASNKARSSAAYEPAYGYLKIAHSLLDTDKWERDYDFTLDVYTKLAELAYLTGRHDEMQSLAEEGLAQAKSIIDKIGIYETMIGSAAARVKFPEAIEASLQALNLLGTKFPARPSKLAIITWLLKIKIIMRGKKIEDLAKLPENKDPHLLAEMRILQHLASAAYWVDTKLLALCIFRRMEISLKHGNSFISPSSYASYGMFLTGILGDIENGYRFGQLALKLQDKSTSTQLKPRTNMVTHVMINHWKVHTKEAIQPMLDNYQMGLDVGDLDFASNSIMAYGYHIFHTGKELATAGNEINKYRDVLRYRLKQERSYRVLSLYGQTVRILTDKENYKQDFTQDCFEEEKYLDKLISTSQNSATFLARFLKAILCYHLGQPTAALEYIEKANKFLDGVMGTLADPIATFFDSLARLATYADADHKARKLMLKTVAANQKRMHKLAGHAPMNHLHRYWLVEAELQRVLGRNEQAGCYYDQAIAAAHENGYLQEEALANELAGKFYLDQKREKLARLYMTDARLAYQRWGANAIVAHLDNKYPQLLAGSTQRRALSDSISAATATVTASSMDLKSLMLALKDIAEEKVHSKIIEKTIHRCIEFAGAQSGFMLLRGPNNELLIEAEVTVNPEKIEILCSKRVALFHKLSPAVINYVKRSKQSVVIQNAQEPQELIPNLHAEDYIRHNNIKSILCIPFLAGTGETMELVGLIYLENNAASYAFTEKRIETLEIICLSAAGRLELSRKAVTDGLTGLYNHDYFQGVLLKEISLSQRNKRELSLIMVDIDHFKKFNDTWGHQVGDLVLQHTANLIKESCRQSDVVVRYGGEEMAVILPEANEKTAMDVAQRIRSSIEAATVNHGQEKLKVTVSLGVSSLHGIQDNSKTLIKRADMALYKSKEKGRNRVTVG